jgi:hypothetical protein
MSSSSIVNTGIPVGDAGAVSCEGKEWVIRGMVPKPEYRLFNVWDAENDRLSNTTDWTTTARCLPRPPPEDSELANEVNAHLFNISTPMNIDKFETLLQNHPTLILLGRSSPD